MSHEIDTSGDARQLSFLVIAHGMAVLFVGLLAGVMLVFSLLEAVTLWPLPAWDVSIPGSTRGWQAAHVGGIMNGILVGGMALLMNYLAVEGARAKIVGWGMIITGWGNTIFYWAGNFSANRGLSVASTPFGEGDFPGALAFLGGGVAMFCAFVAVALLGMSAFEKSRFQSGT